MRTRRASIQIIADILRLGEAGKTDIGLYANLGYPQLDRYLEFLVKGGFLERRERPVPRYQVTPQGRELLESICRVTEALELGKA